MAFACTPFGALFRSRYNDPLSFEASISITHTVEENKACSTLATLPHKPAIDEQEENRRTVKIKREKREEGGGGGFDSGLGEGGSGGPLMRPATLHHQAANDG